jgi:hypothetical protein
MKHAKTRAEELLRAAYDLIGLCEDAESEEWNLSAPSASTFYGGKSRCGHQLRLDIAQELGIPPDLHALHGELRGGFEVASSSLDRGRQHIAKKGGHIFALCGTRIARDTHSPWGVGDLIWCEECEKKGTQ